MGMVQLATVGMIVGKVSLHLMLFLLNNRHRRYDRPLLERIRAQPTRNILPVTLRKRQEQIQPGEQPQGDHAWTGLS